MKVKRGLLVSCSIILLCMTIIVGMTYALFTDSVSVQNHLKAGKLDVTLTRTDLTYSVLDTNGKLKTESVPADLDFTNSTSENVFGIDTATNMIVPGSFFEATMVLANNGNVAFTYDVKLQLLSASNKLAEQLKVTVTHPDGTKTTKMLSEISNGLLISAGEMEATAAAKTFTVRVEFINNTAINNAAQDLTAVFDLSVSATQYVETTAP